MLPIRDNVRARTLPWVTYLLVAANIFVFVYELGLYPALQEQVAQTWGLVPSRYPTFAAAVLSGTPVTSMFMHAGAGHLFGNLLFLFVFGDNVEDWLGHGRYLVFYLACGLTAALTQYTINPLSAIPMVGASGAISGVLGAYLVLYPRARLTTLWIFIIFPRLIELPAILYLVGWFAFQLLSGLAVSPDATEGGVAFWAHIGGFVAGLLTVRIFGLMRAGAR